MLTDPECSYTYFTPIHKFVLTFGCEFKGKWTLKFPKKLQMKVENNPLLQLSPYLRHLLY